MKFGRQPSGLPVRGAPRRSAKSEAAGICRSKKLSPFSPCFFSSVLLKSFNPPVPRFGQAAHPVSPPGRSLHARHTPPATMRTETARNPLRRAISFLNRLNNGGAISSTRPH